MKKLIDVSLPITGSITVPVEADNDADALSLALSRISPNDIHDLDGNGAIFSFAVDGNYVTLTDADDPSGTSCRDVEIRG